MAFPKKRYFFPLLKMCIRDRFVGDGEKEVVSLAQTYLNINASMYWVLALLFVFRYTLQGLGQSLSLIHISQ